MQTVVPAGLIIKFIVRVHQNELCMLSREYTACMHIRKKDTVQLKLPCTATTPRLGCQMYTCMDEYKHSPSVRMFTTLATYNTQDRRYLRDTRFTNAFAEHPQIRKRVEGSEYICRTPHHALCAQKRKLRLYVRNRIT